MNTPVTRASVPLIQNTTQLLCHHSHNENVEIPLCYQALKNKLITPLKKLEWFKDHLCIYSGSCVFNLVATPVTMWNLEFQVKFYLEGQGHTSLKSIGLFIKVFLHLLSELVILAWVGDELSHGQSQRLTHTDTQTQADTPGRRRFPNWRQKPVSTKTVARFMHLQYEQPLYNAGSCIMCLFLSMQLVS